MIHQSARSKLSGPDEHEIIAKDPLIKSVCNARLYAVIAQISNIYSYTPVLDIARVTCGPFDGCAEQ